MEFYTPEYARDLLKPTFKDISINNYYKLCKGDYAKDRGVSVLAYRDPHNVSISFLEGGVKFFFEAEERTIVRSFWKYEDVNESTYEYFLFIIRKHIKDRNDTKQYASDFDSKHWINRDKKLSDILK